MDFRRMVETHTVDALRSEVNTIGWATVEGREMYDRVKVSVYGEGGAKNWAEEMMEWVMI